MMSKIYNNYSYTYFFKLFNFYLKLFQSKVFKKIDFNGTSYSDI